MKLTFKADIDISSEQEEEARKNPIAFFKRHFETKGFNDNQIKLTQILVEPDIGMSYHSYGFTNDVVDWLNSIGIHNIEDVFDFTYEQIKMSVPINLFSFSNYHQIKHYIPCLIQAMKEHSIIRFKDIYISDLKPIEILGLSARISNALKDRGIIYVQDITFFTKDEIFHTPNIGEKSLCELEEKMKEFDINFNNNITSEAINTSKIKKMSYNTYDFPNRIVDWLNSIGVYRIEFTNNFTYKEIRLARTENGKNSFNNVNCIDFNLFIETMKKNHVNFKDMDVNSLLSISECNLSVRTENGLKRGGIFFLQDVSFFTSGEIYSIRNISKKCQAELEVVMKEHKIWYRNK